MIIFINQIHNNLLINQNIYNLILEKYYFIIL
jgi:hypothetical protein